MYMDPKIRRTIILLSSIPKGAPVKLIVTYVVNSKHESNFDMEFVSVSPEENVAIFLQHPGGDEHAYPLDKIETVYRPHRSKPAWNVLVGVVPRHEH